MLGRWKDSPEEAQSPPAAQENAFAPTQVRTVPAAPVLKRLGDLLLEERLITPEQYERAAAITKEKGGFLGQVLVQQGLVTQGAIASCLVKHCKIPHLSLMDYDIGAEVLALIPKEICEKYKLLPIDKLGRILTVAMVDPLDPEAIEQVHAACPELRIKPILCNWEHFDLVFGRVYGAQKGPGGASVSMQSLGLSAHPPAPKPKPEPAPTAEMQSVGPAATTPSVAPEELTTLIRAGIGDALKDALSQLTVPPAAPSAPANAAVSPELVAMTVRDSIKEVLAQNAEVQQKQEARLAQIAEALLQSVQQNSRLVEGNVVKEQVRHDLDPSPRKRHSSVVPFTRFAQGAAEGAAEERRESDERVMEALYSETPLETLSFENFYPGNANEFTFKLAQGVAAQPGLEYNPFFLYGKVGIGKTHLISAIGNAILKADAQQRVGYVSASHFARRLQEAAKDAALDAFRENYAHWDVLILDDIQFMGGRVEPQEEFFHIFNVLHQQARQIIIASDKAPDRLGLLEQRLISRFASGIVAELKAPEWETRVQILRHHLAETADQAKVPEEILSLIAMRVPNDVRRMTGALRKVMAFARLADEPMALETVNGILGHFGENEPE